MAEDIGERKWTDHYEVTREGRVYSLTSDWRGYGRRELAQQPNSHGYPSVRFQLGAKRQRRLVHALVAETFLPPRPSPAHQIRHLNGNKGDNRVENLAWGTAAENAADRDTHGTTARGDVVRKALREGRARSSNPFWRHVRNNTEYGQ